MGGTLTCRKQGRRLEGWKRSHEFGFQGYLPLGNIPTSQGQPLKEKRGAEMDRTGRI